MHLAFNFQFHFLFLDKLLFTMSSSVFFKFKSSKEPQRITFDGTGISVFELKREIISATGLGDGTDFDLSIYTDDTNEGQYALTST